MAALNNLFIRRYCRFKTMSQDIYLFDPVSFSLSQKAPAGQKVHGWLIDYEKIISGDSTIIFLEQDEKKYICANRVIFELTKQIKVVHKRSIILSKLSLEHKDKKILVIKYITPWWRLIFDDGSHTDLAFPLEYFAKKWSGHEMFFESRSG